MSNIYPAVRMAAFLAAMQMQAGHIDADRAFTEDLYEAYQQGKPDYLEPRAAPIFAPHLLTLIRRDQAVTPPGEVGTLDLDPICNCGGDSGMKAERVEVQEVAPRHVLGTVLARFSDEATTVKLDLVSGPGRWRLADSHTKNVSSLVILLEKSVGSATARSNPHNDCPFWVETRPAIQDGCLAVQFRAAMRHGARSYRPCNSVV